VAEVIYAGENPYVLPLINASPAGSLTEVLLQSVCWMSVTLVPV